MMNSPDTVVDLKVTRKSGANDTWLTIIDYKSCYVIFGDLSGQEDSHEERQKIKVYSCYAA